MLSAAQDHRWLHRWFFQSPQTLTRGAAAKIICNMMLGPTTAAALGV
jgi:hypothetical protein